MIVALAACGGETSRGEQFAPPADAGNESAADAGSDLWCEPFAACGGDVVGNWRIVSGCYEPDFLHDECSSYDYYELEEQGTYQFFGDGTYASDISYSLAYTAFEQRACLTGSCAEREQQLQMSSEGQMVTASCSMTDDGCLCDVHSSGHGQGGGSYSVTGNELQVVVDGQTGAYTPWEYCVSGSELRLHIEGISGATLQRN